MPLPSSYGPVSFFNLTGDPTLDAFINFQYKWGASAVGTAVTVTYSFPQAGASWAAGYGEGEPGGLTGFNASQQAAATDALNLWSEVANITFQKVDESPSEVGDIRFGFSSVVSNDPYAIAWGYFPYPSPEAGDVWLDPAYGPNLQMQPGGFGFSTLLHEIGHAIGLDHPFDDGYGEPVLPGWQDNMQYTVMAYDPHPSLSMGEPTGLLLLDILAIQYLYGANMTTRAGDDVYAFANAAQVLKAIWDAGGNDTIDTSQQTSRVIIDLNEGAFSSIGINKYGSLATDNIAIAYGALIENAKGGSAGDTLTGNGVANLLYGNAGADTLTGGLGNDTLDGGIGADRMYGGGGNDFYFVDSASDTIDEQGSADIGDQIFSSVAVNLTTLGKGAIENAILITNAAVGITGNNSNNSLAGGEGANTITGAGGDDFLFGFGGNDNLSDTSGSNYMDGGAGNDTMTGGSGNDAMFGGIGNDIMNAGAGASNYLDGGDGNDKLVGGAGNDTLLGGAGNDTLDGGAGADFLDGGTGDDVLTGGQGADIYVIDGAGDKVVETGTDGPDEIRTIFSIDLRTFGNGKFEHTRLLGNQTLSAIGNATHNLLWGNAVSNLLLGLDGGDLLDGGFGADIMKGGAGNDHYVVENLGDVVDEENNNDTFDTVMGLFSFDLNTYANGKIENAVLLGPAALNAIGSDVDNQLIGGAGQNKLEGKGGNDSLVGNEGDDILIGAQGNDILIGGLGKDTLTGGVGFDLLLGGAGSDIYVLDDLSDTIDEQGNIDSGDEIQAAFNLALASFGGGSIENATLLGTGNLNAIGTNANNKLVGNSGVNTLESGLGNDYLDGGLGDDILRGGGGNDTYVIDSLTDAIDEQGNTDKDDEVRTGAFNLALATLAGGVIEHATLLGNTALNLTGTNAANRLTGNDASNTLDGGGGNDVLDGGKGDDTLIGGSGVDKFLGGEGDDAIVVSSAADVSTLAIDGGTGTDTLQFTGNLDFTNIGQTTIQNVEIIDMSGGGASKLTASAQDVADMIGSGTKLFILGDDGDTVAFTSSATHTGSSTINGIVYEVYNDGTSAVYIDAEVKAIATPPAAFQLSKLDDTLGFRIAPATASSLFGSMLAAAGDVNQDGFEDMLITGGQVAYLLYGQAAAYDGPLNANNPVGANVAELIVNSGFNSPVSGLGDFNGDGVADFTVGDPGVNFDAIGSGGAYVVYGDPGTPFDQLTLSSLGASDAARFGGGVVESATLYRGLGEVGDMNGDGYEDLLFSAYNAFSNNAHGVAYVAFGRSDQPGTVPAANLDGNNGFSFNNPNVNRTIGTTISGGIDVNGDGYNDIVVSETDRAHVIFGHSGAFDANLQVPELNGNNGFTITGGTLKVGYGGDFNGDGYQDIVLSDPSVAQGGISSSGAVYVIFGKAAGFGTIDISQLNGTNGFVVTGLKGQEAGESTCLTGDYNADGYDDLLIGAPGSVVGTQGAGSVFIVYGHAGAGAATMSLASMNGFNGFEIVGLGGNDDTGGNVASADLNGDGFDDIIFSADESVNNGMTYVVYGKDETGGTAIGTNAGETLNSFGGASAIAAGQGNDIVNGGGGADAINAGQGNDEIHVADNKFFRIDGGTGIDTLHLDYSGAIDFGNLDGNASTSDRGRIENVEIIDVVNGQANAMTLHIADVLDIDATVSDVGGIAALDNVLRIDGEAGDTLQLFSADGWGAADTSTLTGYAIYTYQAVKVAVDADIVVTVT